MSLPQHRPLSAPPSVTVTDDAPFADGNRLAPVPTNAGPANEIIAMLALAMSHDPDVNKAADYTRADARWSPAKTLTMLFVGSGLFWVLSLVALRSLI